MYILVHIHYVHIYQTGEEAAFGSPHHEFLKKMDKNTIAFRIHVYDNSPSYV